LSAPAQAIEAFGRRFLKLQQNRAGLDGFGQDRIVDRCDLGLVFEGRRMMRPERYQEKNEQKSEMRCGFILRKKSHAGTIQKSRAGRPESPIAQQPHRKVTKTVVSYCGSRWTRCLRCRAALKSLWMRSHHPALWSLADQIADPALSDSSESAVIEVIGPVIRRVYLH
jgi:hypothetical protein